MEKNEKREIRISVRNLVEFLLRSGDIDHRRRTVADKEAMQAGSRIHRRIQKNRGVSYQAEVPLKYTREYEKFVLTVEGRADGIYEAGGEYWIEEIKGIYADPRRMNEPIPVHLAQAKCYAAVYAVQQGLEQIHVRMTYVHLESEEEFRFESFYEQEELDTWFRDLVSAYAKWASVQVEWAESRNQSMQGLEFPYAYREGQRDLVIYVYRTILRGRQLFAQAPTGIGKTMSTVFPAVRAVGEGRADKLFYLTAKTITRTVAEEAFAILREKGLLFKSLTITAKEKICVCDSCECDPDHCVRARGHFDRVNDAMFELLQAEDAWNRETILTQAEKWEICPYEFQMDLSDFADAVICDYNYAFDPSARLKRYFSEGAKKGNYVFLIDEAHNLVERGRDMFSASLTLQDFIDAGQAVRKEKGKYKPGGKKKKEKETQLTFSFSEEKNSSVLLVSDSEEKNTKEKNTEEKNTEEKDLLKKLAGSITACRHLLQDRKENCEECEVIPYLGDLSNRLLRLIVCMEELYAQKGLEELRENLLDFYFRLLHFTEIEELLDDNYVIYEQRLADDDFLVRLFCVNPAANLQSCLSRGVSTVFFSATLLPVAYYEQMLTTETDNYAVYIPSPFHSENRMLKMAVDVSSRYSRRNREEYVKIAGYIDAVTSARKGNYLVFFPSYAFMEAVYDLFIQGFADDEESECLLQTASMSETEKEEFLNQFSGKEEKSKIGFCVMGGVFSEGIDLKGEKLIGVLVVGTGIPQISQERELLRQYFDGQGRNGFDYAYRFPGMNKVLQAAGRVIRTDTDEGVILLLDDRFQERQSVELFPREWRDITVTNLRTIGAETEEFWKMRQ